MSRSYRKKSNVWKVIFTILIIILVISGIGVLYNHFNNNVDEEGRVKISLNYKIGGLNAEGKYEETKQSIYTKDAFKCEGLNILYDFDSTITYKVFFYDNSGNYISSTESLEADYKDEIPSDAYYARIVITPIWTEGTDDNDKEINIFQIYKYAKQLTVKVIENSSDYPNDFSKISLNDETYFTFDKGCYYGKDGKRVELSNYNSYIFVASKSCEFYMESTAEAVQYVIIKTDGTTVRYQKADNTWVEGKDNTFNLGIGDKVAISTTSSDINAIQFYLRASK